jgi:hypothetical protein
LILRIHVDVGLTVELVLMKSSILVLANHPGPSWVLLLVTFVKDTPSPSVGNFHVKD